MINCDKKARQRYQFFLIAIFIMIVGYYAGTLMKSIYDTVSLLLVPVVILASYVIFIRNSNFKAKNILLMLFSIAIIVLSYLLVGGGLGSVYNNLSCVMYICLFYEIQFCNKEISNFHKWILIFQIYLLFYTLLSGVSYGYVGVYNANTIATQALFNMAIFNVSLINKKLLWIENIISLVIIVYTSARTSLAAALIMFLFLFINNRHKIKEFVLKLLFWVVGILGIMVPSLYTWMYENSSNELISTITQFSIRYFDKNLFTGREYIWVIALEDLTSSMKNILFGIGSHYAIEQFADSNFHNSFFTILICCGAIGYVLILGLLYRLYCKPMRMNSSIASRTCLIYVALMVVGIFESILFSGIYSILGYLVLCFGCTLSAEDSNNKVKKYEGVNDARFLNNVRSKSSRT